MTTLEDVAQDAIKRIKRLKAELRITDQLYSLALAAGSAAKDEIVRLQESIAELRTANAAITTNLERTDDELKRVMTTAQIWHTELETLRDWRTPPYSAAQLEQFEESCYVPPSQFIPWHFLPDVPEIPKDTRGIAVWAQWVFERKKETTEECKMTVFYRHDDGECRFSGTRGWCYVRAWHYLEEKAPPKPEGKAEALELGEPEPQKCKHSKHARLGDEVKNEI